MRLARQFLCAPSARDTLETVALGDGDAVDHLVLFEDRADFHWLLEQTPCEFDLVCDRPTVDLNFHKMRLLLLKRCQGHLGVCEDADNGAVFRDALKIASDALASLLCMLLRVLSESLLLAAVPVLVEPAL